MTRLSTADFPRDPAGVTGNLRAELINCVRRAVTPERVALLSEMLTTAQAALNTTPSDKPQTGKKNKSSPKRVKTEATLIAPTGVEEVAGSE